jgi:predicted dehydrogenase
VCALPPTNQLIAARRGLFYPVSNAPTNQLTIDPGLQKNDIFQKTSVPGSTRSIKIGIAMSNKKQHQNSRRKFIYELGLTAMSVPLLQNLNYQNMESGEEASLKRIRSEKAAGKLGVALVGLGNYATGQLAPALLQTENCFLAGIVTGTPSKAESWKTKYNIPSANIYDYTSFDKIKSNPDIDVIYVVLPNSMHKEYVIRAAAASKHVISEKPLAITVADCDEMIAACKKAGKTLSVGYRLHFEPYNLEMARLGQKKVYGNVKKLTSGFGFSIGDPTQWRLKKDYAGGGPLMDLGIYSIQGFCYILGMEPIAVSAQEGEKTDPVKFKEVEQSISWQFDFPGGIVAEGRCSYGDNANFLRADAEKGWFELTSAFNYSGQRGGTSDAAMNFPHVNQQAKQLDGISESIKANKTSIVPGAMGRRDVKYLQAVYEAMRTGKKVTIPK